MILSITAHKKLRHIKCVNINIVPHQSTQFPFQENMKISGHKKFKQIWMMEHWSCLHWSFMTISSQIYSDIRILRLKSCIAASVLIVCLSPRLISGSSIIHMLTMFGVYICSLVSPTSNKQKSKNTEDEYLRFLLNFFFCIFYILGIIDSVSTLLS